MLQIIFGALLGLSLLYGTARGTGAQVMTAVLQAAREAVETALGLAGAFGFFCGVMNILRRAGAMEKIGAWLAPLLKKLFGPSLPPSALEPVTLNLTANLLGLGNAATPMGVEAARRMGEKGEGRASDALCLFLVINASSVQLLPTTVIALRSAAGSADPGRVILPTLLATAVSTLVGVGACKLMEKRL